MIIGEAALIHVDALLIIAELTLIIGKPPEYGEELTKYFPELNITETLRDIAKVSRTGVSL